MESWIRRWLMVARAPFLLLTILLVGLGTSIALYDDFFNVFHFILALMGMLFAHIACNMLNEYFDYKSGLDFRTIKTPFSGGSGTLPDGLLNPDYVYKVGIICLLLALIVGIYFIIVSGLMLLPIIIVAGISAYFYTTHFSRFMFGEFLAGLNFGPLAILGAYFVQTSHYSFHTLIASIAPGIMTANLLLLNQFPDADEDVKVGRRHFVIILGRKNSSKLYAFLMLVAYLSIISGVVFGMMPIPTLIALLTLPFAIIAVRGALNNYDTINGLIPTLGMNVKTILLTQFLLIVGYLIATLIHY
ncbi:MAG: prenyltransferase [Candidatus Altiarchaeales archaeon]|nr:MAG: prenyltransferase [Candidatus Altiarchaeales archaeon]